MIKYHLHTRTVRKIEVGTPVVYIGTGGKELSYDKVAKITPKGVTLECGTNRRLDQICPTEGPIEGVKNLSEFRADYPYPTMSNFNGNWDAFGRAKLDWARDTYRLWEDYLKKEGVI